MSPFPFQEVTGNMMNSMHGHSIMRTALEVQSRGMRRISLPLLTSIVSTSHPLRGCRDAIEVSKSRLIEESTLSLMGLEFGKSFMPWLGASIVVSSTSSAPAVAVAVKVDIPL